MKPQAAANEIATGNQDKQMSLPAVVRANSVGKRSIRRITKEQGLSLDQDEVDINLSCLF